VKRGLVLLLCCACESTPLADDFDSTLPAVPDDSCARFEFRFEPSGCPEPACAVPVCSCPDPIPCLSGLRDRCAVGMSCEAACAADPTTLFVCASEIAPCTNDDECEGGLCVTEPGRSNGECESGERGARCRNDQDCLLGNCVAGLNGNRACSPGEAFDLCNRDRDCLGGSCRDGECQ
jgi:hypothetical protein